MPEELFEFLEATTKFRHCAQTECENCYFKKYISPDGYKDSICKGIQSLSISSHFPEIARETLNEYFRNEQFEYEEMMEG